MTREKALMASRALEAIEAIEGFQAFKDEIDRAIATAEDLYPLSIEFVHALDTLLRKEEKRLEKVLEDM